MIIKQVNFKDRKNALQIAPKRSAVIPTLHKSAVTPTAQKDSPLLHKGIELEYCGGKKKKKIR